MNTFSESDLQIEFPNDWSVRRFDQTTAYRSVSGHGLKGVDFLCLTPEGELWLVEIKNFRRRNELSSMKRRSPEGLAQQVGKKFSDSKRIIRVVNRAMQQRWWLRLVLLWYAWRKRERPESDYWFWAEAERRLEQASRTVCLLWMETPERTPDYAAAVREFLEEALEPGNQLHIAETKSPGKPPLHVTLNPDTL
ncbi:hypothetical protein CLV84_3230 [Neolewinella xylanilytica]|uniref:NERD domain-containing protein n=1 Tax=Neolewinella xylanilytica TaxID=1514080 RepID=A0A2S6I555_9BACT|nr:hypothetical protein [Neolewinella xylanilytica]PPK86307.1 hypothetical protein CLV84_3230 [Neolewinella xylanilytica]